ncbi:MAG: hypothetical protein JSV75_02640 [Candidatus Bathyarchaeota archaeon]|jgi:hypothetical protein|nr:MAG: hypothetical protein JSV75_02640 [Candidatus Bathyarchaeota archaeon]
MEVVDLHIRTIAAIILWFVVALLLLNRSYRSGWIMLLSIAMVILAVILYFIPSLRK